MVEGILWFFQNIALSFYNLAYAILNPGLWLDWSNPEAVMRFIYYGASAELFFVVFTAFLILTGLCQQFLRYFHPSAGIFCRVNFQLFHRLAINDQ